jgi:hypothetical protein
VKRQLLVAQLAVLFEQRAAQHRFRWQSTPPRLANPIAAQIAAHQAQQLPMLVQPPRDCLQLAADLVRRGDIDYTRLDGAFLTHCPAAAVAGLAADAVVCFRSITETAGL